MPRDSGSERRTALVTGASSGIGYELARIFAQEGYNLVLVARSEGRLREIARRFEERHGVAVTVLPKDLSLPTAPVEIYRALADQGTEVDVLVNNAGFTEYGSFVNTELEHELGMLQVNVFALTHLTKLLLPAMVERGWG